MVLDITIGFLAGFLAIPLLVLILASGLPFNGAIGNVLFTLGQVVNNGSALLYDNQQSKLVPYNHQDGVLFVDGQWHSVNEEDRTVYRLGLRPFAISYDPNETLSRYEVTDAIENAPTVLMDEKRGGYYCFAPYDTTSTGGDLILHVARYVKGIGRGGSVLYNRAEENALKKYAGQDRLSTVVSIVLVMVNLVIMFGLTWVLLGM